MTEIALLIAGLAIGYNIKTMVDGIVYMAKERERKEEREAVERRKFANRYNLYQQIKQGVFEMR